MIDYKNPDYCAIFDQRIAALNRIRAEPASLETLKTYYRNNPAQFISDWGMTFDPMRMTDGRPAVIPFVLFPRQVEWVGWVIERWKVQKPGVTPKSRESGVSWLAIALSCTLCLFYDGISIGFGSRKLELVDSLGDADSLFWKARTFISNLPIEFRGGWTLKDAPERLIKFPSTGSMMKGEGGDDIGRGGRNSIYFVDEAANLAHPELTEASLSQTTNCRIDISTPRGLGGPFHRKVIEWPSEQVFRFHWRDDPRKDDEWYTKQVEELDPVVVAQEIDIDFAASVEGVLIPSAWVQASIDAHKVLGITPTGAKLGALDVADEGRDKNAFCGAYGILIEALEEWSGKGDDIFGTVQRAFSLCDDLDYRSFYYDADGLGAGVRGDARVINEQRKFTTHSISVNSFRGSGGVSRPEAQDVKGRKNQDFFANLKAQAWWSLRTRFQKTSRAVTEGAKFANDEIISISSDLKLCGRLCMELSQPTYSINTVGKIVIDKAPDGAKSPNLADAVMIRYAPGQGQMVFTKSDIAAVRRPGPATMRHKRFRFG